MDFRKIEAFLTVANTGKYTEAAEKLFISQSSLSKQMSQVERELGVKLFKKTRNGVELTQAGYDFYSYARKALPEYQRAVAHLRMYHEGSTYPLRIGALPLTEEYGIADSFSSYWVRNPTVQMEYYERSQEDLVSKLKRHIIDLALIRVDMLDPNEFAFQRVIVDELVVLCSTKHPLANCDVVDISELRNEQFILLEEKSDVTQLFRRACERENFFPSAPLHHSRHRMIVKAVQNNMGISVLPRKLATTYVTHGLATVQLSKPLYSTLGFVWLAEETPTPLMQDFVDYVWDDLNAEFTESPDVSILAKEAGMLAEATSKTRANA